MTAIISTVPACLHCRRRKMAQGRRGLCWLCSLTPAFRELYPSTSKFARRGVGNENIDRLMPEPTTAKPGTPEKMAVLADRAAAGLRLWHPFDSTH